MFLTWAICHDDGREKGWLLDREGGEVSVALNGPRQARVSASLDEPVARLIHPGRTRLKVHLHPLAEDPFKVLLFNGLIQQPRVVNRRVEIPAVCPSARLLKASPALLPVKTDVPDGAFDPIELELSALMWELIWRSDRRARQLSAEPGANTVPKLGILEGELADSGVVREAKASDARTTWDAIVELSGRDRAPDFELEPLDREDGWHARFNTYHPRQGANRRDEVVLEYGNNLSDFNYEPSGVDLVNQYVLIGKGRGRRVAYVAENRMSINRFGIHQQIETAPDVADVETLRRRAHDYVAKRAFPVNFVDVTPTVAVGGQARGWQRDALGNLVEIRDREWMVPPSFGPAGSGGGFDYWIGDTVTVRAKDHLRLYVDKEQPGPATDMYARVTDATFAEVDKGANVVVSHTLSPVVPAAHVGGYETVVQGESY